jgi:hypothetical protein
MLSVGFFVVRLEDESKRSNMKVEESCQKRSKVTSRIMLSVKQKQQWNRDSNHTFTKPSHKSLGNIDKPLHKPCTCTRYHPLTDHFTPG